MDSPSYQVLCPNCGKEHEVPLDFFIEGATYPVEKFMRGGFYCLLFSLVSWGNYEYDHRKKKMVNRYQV